MINTIMNATGIKDIWLLATIVLAVLCVILLIVAIVNIAKKRGLRRELAELKEYSTGLEAMTKLPPMKMESLGSSDSVVFASAKELKRMEQGGANVQPAAQAAAAPAAQAPAQPAAQADNVNVTAAVHDAILASVTGAHPAVSAEGAATQAAAKRPQDNPLAGRIPKI